MELPQTMGVYPVCQPAAEMDDTLAASPAGIFLNVLGCVALRKSSRLP